MTSRTGSRIQRVRRRRGFTLVEVMIACAVLSIGLVLVMQSFFQCLNAYAYSSEHIFLMPFADEKLWEAQESIEASGVLSIEREGELDMGGRTAQWSIASDQRGKGLYEVSVKLSWSSGTKLRELSRTAYALYFAPEAGE